MRLTYPLWEGYLFCALFSESPLLEMPLYYNHKKKENVNNIIFLDTGNNYNTLSILESVYNMLYSIRLGQI